MSSVKDEAVGERHEKKVDFAQRVEVQAARFEAILRAARDAIISINDRGRITLFNDAAEWIFGYSSAEVLGENVSVLMPSPYRQEHDQYIRAYQETGVAQAIGQIRKVEGQRRNGERFPMELSVSEVSVRGETLYTAVIRDVAERRDAEMEIERLRLLSAQRQRLADIGALTAKIVHDLANPIAALSMVSQGIVRKVERAPDAAIDTIRAQADRLVSTAGRLMSLLGTIDDFARGQRLDVEEIDILAVLRAVEHFWRSEADRNDVELVLDAGEEPILIFGDAEKLTRVFDNLLMNAFDAMGGRPGRVEIRAERRPDGAVGIRFSDSGSGLPEGRDVFELFETTKAAGTGLGLPICKQILSAHGADIFAEDGGGELGGAVFRIEIPPQEPPTS